MKTARVAAVTLMGNKHMQRGVPCEDSSLALERNNVSVVVVSDGAGGKEYTHARYGSKITCETVAQLLTDHFDAIYYENREAAVKNLIIAAIHTNMAAAIEKFKLDSLERLSCTLVFCAVKDRRIICGHIGDGLIVRVSSSGLSPITMPQNGERASSTYFVTASHAADYLRFVKMTTDDIHGIAIMTDGVQDLVYDENSGLVRPVIAKMVDTLKGGRETCEKELNLILEKYVVGASNVSDDASFGIMLLSETASPAPDKLSNTADAFPRNNKDTFKDLQMEWLPKVKSAKNVIINAGTGKFVLEKTDPEITCENIKDDHQSKKTEDKIGEIEEKRRVGDGFVLGIIIGILISALLIFLLYFVLS
ncbi:MAG: protein phosphatase 2C domain-containing protein [Clostridiales bacterium]|nr:protein phosphatase 2C domain-containing protein [Clostridiales bacterium]